MAKNPKKGWYADPASPGREREWDGSAWTDARRDAPPKRPGDTVRKVALGVVLGLVVLIGGCTAIGVIGVQSDGTVTEGSVTYAVTVDGITRAQFDGVKQGATQSSVEADLGTPDDAQESEQNISEPSNSSCIYYPEKGKNVLEGSSFQLCFDDGKLSSKNVY